MTYLTNEMIRSNCPPNLCPGCCGWGFPIMAFGGKEVYNPRMICDECGGDGLRESYNKRLSDKTA